MKLEGVDFCFAALFDVLFVEGFVAGRIFFLNAAFVLTVTIILLNKMLL